MLNCFQTLFIVNYHINLSRIKNMIRIWIYLTITICLLRLTTNHHVRLKNWIYHLFMSHKQYSKIFCFKELGLLILTKFWFHLFVSSSTSSLKKVNSLAFQISISQHSIYSLLHIIKFLFNILTFFLVVLFSNYLFSPSANLGFNLVQIFSWFLF